MRDPTTIPYLNIRQRQGRPLSRFPTGVSLVLVLFGGLSPLTACYHPDYVVIMFPMCTPNQYTTNTQAVFVNDCWSLT